MVKEERAGQEEKQSAMASSEVSTMVPVTPEEPTAPKGISDDEAQKVRSQAIELVTQLSDATGSEELELLDGAADVGIQVQRSAAGQLDLLKTRMSTFLNEDGTSKDIAEGLRDLRLTLNEINPHELTQPGIRDRVFGGIPFFGGRYNPVARALSKIAIRYEPASLQVAVIETKLRDGRALLLRDNVEMRKLYEDVKAQQQPIQRNVYLGELLIQHFSRLLEQSEEPAKRERLQAALHDVAMRVQDLRTMEEVHVQYLVSIEMGRRNNRRLAQSVDRTVTLATNVVTVGLAIQSALIRQKRVAEATLRTREFLGDLIAANAGAIRRHTQEIGDLNNSPVIAMEKISQAHDDLVEALNTASQVRQEGIEAARDRIAKLREMSESIGQRIRGVLEDVESRPGSVEA